MRSKNINDRHDVINQIKDRNYLMVIFVKCLRDEFYIQIQHYDVLENSFQKRIVYHYENMANK